MLGCQGGVRDTFLLRLRFLGRELVSLGDLAKVLQRMKGIRKM
jgi:hypothetical protein